MAETKAEKSGLLVNVLPGLSVLNPVGGAEVKYFEDMSHLPGTVVFKSIPSLIWELHRGDHDLEAASRLGSCSLGQACRPCLAATSIAVR